MSRQDQRRGSSERCAVQGLNYAHSLTLITRRDSCADVRIIPGCKEVELAHVDLTDFASIQSFVDELQTTKLDAVLINAGMMTPKFELTKDSWETT